MSSACTQRRGYLTRAVPSVDKNALGQRRRRQRRHQRHARRRAPGRFAPVPPASKHCRHSHYNGGAGADVGYALVAAMVPIVVSA